MGKNGLFFAFEETLTRMSLDRTLGLQVLRQQVCEKPCDPHPVCFVMLSPWVLGKHPASLASTNNGKLQLFSSCSVLSLRFLLQTEGDFLLGGHFSLKVRLSGTSSMLYFYHID